MKPICCKLDILWYTFPLFLSSLPHPLFDLSVHSVWTAPKVPHVSLSACQLIQTSEPGWCCPILFGAPAVLASVAICPRMFFERS